MFQGSWHVCGHFTYHNRRADFLGQVLLAFLGAVDLQPAAAWGLVGRGPSRLTVALHEFTAPAVPQNTAPAAIDLWGSYGWGRTAAGGIPEGGIVPCAKTV